MFVISCVSYTPPESPSKFYWHPANGSNWDGMRGKGNWVRLSNRKMGLLSRIPVKCYYTAAAAKAVITRHGWKNCSLYTYAIEEI